jgi:hypothetical protein
MASADKQFRMVWFRKIAIVLLGMLFVKVLLSILYQYQWYFPADFEQAAFLLDRKKMFVGAYRFAFYVHIIASPVAVVVGLGLMISGGRSRFQKAHRWAGRLVVLIAVFFVAPSGVVMSTQAFSGPIAGLGFASLAVATAGTAAAAYCFARRRKFMQHQKWATRCFILLCSPFLLRLMTGAAFVTDVESVLTYRLSAWLSWLAPWAVYEIWLWKTNCNNCTKDRFAKILSQKL